MHDWDVRQLTTGTGNGRYHAHSYYDIPVFDPGSRFIAAHRMTFADRPITADDAIRIGLVDVADGAFEELGSSTAWSWQQGPLAQWMGGRTTRLCWNARDGDRFVTHVWNGETNTITTLDHSTYAVDPAGGFTLGINMARLDTLRPGYGYAGGAGACLDEPAPSHDGVWRQDIVSGARDLILSLARARDHLLSLLASESELQWLCRYFANTQEPVFWFNHVKIAPSGTRFTVKLRFRSLNGGWSDEQGVSLTCNTDGSALSLLASAPSHVIWYDDHWLFLWQRDAFYFFLDQANGGRRERALAPEAVTRNAHVRFLPQQPGTFVADTPYRESIDLFLHDESSGQTRDIALFEHHRPAASAFRCDLHPCPSPDGRHIVVTSLHDGGRQLYLLTRDAPVLEDDA